MCTRDPHWPSGDLRQDCNARLVSTGEDVTLPVVCFAIQLFGQVLFFAFPARYLLVENNNVAPIVVGAIIGMCSLVFFSCACLTDPGVIPPAETAPYLSHEVRPPRTQHVLTSHGKFTLKYCDVCNIYRPQRAEHCPTCKNCILKFDHRRLMSAFRASLN